MSRELELLKEAVALLEEKEHKQEVSCADKDQNNEKVELSTLLPGETFKIGEHDFIVLEQKTEISQTMVISKEFMEEDVVFGSDIRDYNKSNIKKVIETDILPIIEKEVGAENIVEHEVDFTSVDMQNEFSSCKCKVRPITFDEARKYNDLLPNDDLDDWWWTCTPWSSEKRGWKHSIAVVSSSGGVNGYDCSDDGGVRPFCILKSNIFVSKGE